MWWPSNGTSNFCTVASDSPSSPRSFAAIPPTVFQHLLLGRRRLPLSQQIAAWQFTAFSQSTKWLPNC